MPVKNCQNRRWSCLTYQEHWAFEREDRSIRLLQNDAEHIVRLPGRGVLECHDATPLQIEEGGHQIAVIDTFVDQ